MKKKQSYSIGLFILLSSFLLGHCQVPCGIYDDALRIYQIKEHISTIGKAMIEIQSLSNKETNALSNNQLVRWINTKDNHATLIQDIISDYFLTQRIKFVNEDDPAREKYVLLTTTLQQMLVTAMKCKQTIDPENTVHLSELTGFFSGLYLDKHGLEHLINLGK
ncbi:MAG: superoxide dismutase [Ni] [Fidelibacterota bacterium]